MKTLKPFPSAADAAGNFRSFRNAFCLVALLALPELAFAQEDFQENACGFLDNIVGLLGIASIAVVTIAIVFAGYQIAFAHKRMGDVAPILIGGLLIGGAGQLASWILQKDDQSCEAGITMVQQAMQYLA
jgi:type IV secretion system protein VirB2